MSSHIAMWRTTVREAGRQMTSRKIKVKRWKAKSSGRSCIKIGKIWRMHLCRPVGYHLGCPAEEVGGRLPLLVPIL